MLMDPGDTQFVSSDEATTCHIIIARNTTSQTTFLCHFDGQGISVITRELENFASDTEGSSREVCWVLLNRIEITEIDLHVSGGFADAKGESMRVSRTLFTALASVPRTIHLRTLCVHESNTLRLVSRFFHAITLYQSIHIIIKPPAEHNPTLPGDDGLRVVLPCLAVDTATGEVFAGYPDTKVSELDVCWCQLQ